MLSFFNQPYPSDPNFGQGLKNAIGISIFAAIFFMVFRPFGLGRLPWEHLLPLVGLYALIHLICFLLVSQVGRLIFPSFYQEDHWTVGKEFLILFLLLFFISVGCYGVNIWQSLMDPSWSSFFTIWFNVIAFGALPIIFSVLLNYNRKLKKHLMEVGQINSIIQTEKKEEPSIEESISLQSDNKKEEFLFIEKEFYFAESSANYVTLIYSDNGVVSKKILRTTLKNILEQVQDCSSIVRCHRSFIINLNQIEKVDGNSRGYEIFLKNDAGIVPVSRSYIPIIKSFLNIP